MKTLTRDYHGFTVDEAIHDIESILFSINYDEYSTLRILTGRGPLHDAIVDYLDYSEIEWNHEPNNNGCIVALLPYA